MKIVVTPKRAIKDIKELFSIDNKMTKGTLIHGYEINGKFNINKQFKERFEVLDMLQAYFKDKMFIPGYGLVMGNITFIYTDFQIKEI